MAEYTDDYFINLTMNYDERIDEIYCAWAVWCAKSEDKYYIDGKDGHFYTHVRTDREIEIERKRREIIELEHTEEIPLDKEGHPTEQWMQYTQYLQEFMMDEEKLLNEKPMTFEEWKEQQDESM